MRRPGRPQPPSHGPLPRLAATLALGLAALGALALQITPLAGTPPAWKPDLVFAVLAFFALRRPDAAPLWLVALLLVARDAMTGSPPGLGALSLLLALEALRAHALSRPPPRAVLGDWAAASAAWVAALGLQWLLLALSLAHTPPIAALGPSALATILVIPPVAALLRYVLRVGASPREARA